MRYAFIDEHRDQWPVRRLCEVLDVSPAGFYAWVGRPKSPARQRRDALLAEVKAIHSEFKGRYGSPRIHAELVARGHAVPLALVEKDDHLRRLQILAARATEQAGVHTVAHRHRLGPGRRHEGLRGQHPLAPTNRSVQRHHLGQVATVGGVDHPGEAGRPGYPELPRSRNPLVWLCFRHVRGERRVGSPLAGHRPGAVTGCHGDGSDKRKNPLAAAEEIVYKNRTDVRNLATTGLSGP